MRTFRLARSQTMSHRSMTHRCEPKVHTPILTLTIMIIYFSPNVTSSKETILFFSSFQDDHFVKSRIFLYFGQRFCRNCFPQVQLPPGSEQESLAHRLI